MNAKTTDYYAKTYANLKRIMYSDDHANKTWAALELLNLGYRKTVERAANTAKSKITQRAVAVALRRWKP